MTLSSRGHLALSADISFAGAAGRKGCRLLVGWRAGLIPKDAWGSSLSHSLSSPVKNYLPRTSIRLRLRNSHHFCLFLPCFWLPSLFASTLFFSLTLIISLWQILCFHVCLTLTRNCTFREELIVWFTYVAAAYLPSRLKCRNKFCCYSWQMVIKIVGVNKLKIVLDLSNSRNISSVDTSIGKPLHLLIFCVDGECCIKMWGLKQEKMYTFCSFPWSNVSYLLGS